MTKQLAEFPYIVKGHPEKQGLFSASPILGTFMMICPFLVASPHLAPPFLPISPTLKENQSNDLGLFDPISTSHSIKKELRNLG